MISRRFNEIKKVVAKAVQRFPVFSVLLAAFSLFSIYYIFAEKNYTEILEGVALGTVLALFGETAHEYGVIKHRITTVLLPAIGTVISVTALYKVDNCYPEMAMCGIGFALIALFFYIIYKDRQNEKALSHLIKSGFICGVAASIINAGFIVCILAFNLLIFNFDDVYKFIGALSVLTGILFYGVLFSSFIPAPDEELTVPKVYRLLIHKGLFYIYLLLIGILYLYIGKIIIIHKMPVGRFNWFGCFALTFFVLFWLTVDVSDGSIQKWFKRYGAILMLPVVAVQIIGIYIRVSSYGLTTLRCMSMVLILMAAVFMIASLVKLPVKYAFAGVAVIALLFSCTPLNVVDIPNRNQEHRLEQALTEAGILSGSQINENVKLSDEARARVASPYQYLRDSGGKKSELFNELAKTKLARTELNIGSDEDPESFSFYADLEGREFNIEGYKTFERVSAERSKIGDVDLTEFFLSADPDSDSIVYKDDSMAIFFEFIEYSYDDAENASWAGYVLKK